METLQDLRESLEGTKQGSLLVGAKVSHNKFKSGTIVSTGIGRVEIDFDTYGSKLIQYPESFGKFLEIDGATPEVLAMVNRDKEAVETELNKRLNSIVSRVESTITKAKKFSAAPLVIKVPYCFNEVCAEATMKWNIKQRGCICGNGVCGQVSTKDGLSYELIQEQIECGSHICISQSLYNNGIIEIADSIEISTEQLIIFVAYPVKSKAVDRVLLGAGTVISAQGLSDKETTLIQFDKSKLLLLTEVESMETNFNSALSGKRAQQLIFSTHKKLAVPEAMELVCQIKEVLEKSDSRYDMAVDFLEQLKVLRVEEKTVQKRGRPRTI